MAVRVAGGLAAFERGGEDVQIEAGVIARCVRLPAGHVEPLRPARRHVLAVGARDDVAGHAHVKNFPHPRRRAALRDEVLAQRDAGVAEIASAHERRSRRSAHRALAVGALEHHAARRQPVNVRRGANLVPVAAEHARAQVVRHDEEDVLRRRGGVCKARQAQAAEEGEKKFFHGGESSGAGLTERVNGGPWLDKAAAASRSAACPAASRRASRRGRYGPRTSAAAGRQGGAGF